MPPHAVLLDIDDTLIDTRGAFTHALERISAAYLRQGVDAAELSTFWRADRHDWYRAYTRGEIDYRAQRMRRANDLHAEYGGPTLDEADFDVWDQSFEQFFQEGWRTHDDVEAFLDELDAAQIPYGAVSNASVAYQTHKLEHCGLARVPMLVGVDTFGVGKPDARVFSEGARLLGVEPGQAVYIGDEYDIDAKAAVAAGLVGVWLDRPGARRPGVPDSAPQDPDIVHVTSLVSVNERLSVLAGDPS